MFAEKIFTKKLAVVACLATGLFTNVYASGVEIYNHTNDELKVTCVAGQCVKLGDLNRAIIAPTTPFKAEVGTNFEADITLVTHKGQCNYHVNQTVDHLLALDLTGCSGNIKGTQHATTVDPKGFAIVEILTK